MAPSFFTALHAKHNNIQLLLIQKSPFCHQSFYCGTTSKIPLSHFTAPFDAKGSEENPFILDWHLSILRWSFRCVLFPCEGRHPWVVDQNVDEFCQKRAPGCPSGKSLSSLGQTWAASECPRIWPIEESTGDDFVALLRMEKSNHSS